MTTCIHVSLCGSSWCREKAPWPFVVRDNQQNQLITAWGVGLAALPRCVPSCLLCWAWQKAKKSPKRFWKRWKKQWTYLILSQLGLVVVFFWRFMMFLTIVFVCVLSCVLRQFFSPGHVLCCGHLLGGQLGSWWSNLYLFGRRKLFSVISICGCYCEQATFLPAG